MNTNLRRPSLLVYLGILFAVQILIVVYFLSAVLPAGGVPFDDAWIHFVFARNMAERGEVSFIPGQWSGGTTSLLWDVLIALGYRLSGQMLTTAYVLGSICYLLTAAMLFLLLIDAFGSIQGGRELALATAIGFAMTSFIPYLALSGMDTLLFLALALVSLLMFMRRHYHFAGWLLAALVLTRIEGGGLVVLLSPAAFLREWRQRRWRRFVEIVAPPLLTLSSYFLFNWSVTGYYLPTTMVGRKWLWGLPEGVWVFSPERTLSYFQEWSHLVGDFIFVGNGWLTLVFVGLAVAGLIGAMLGIVRRWPGILGMVLLVAWVLTHNLAYLVLAPFASWRHQAPNLILLPALAALGLVSLLKLWPRYRQWGAVLGGVVMCACLLPGTVAYRQTFADNVTHINRVHVAAGEWIAAFLPDDAVVAAFDIGAICYWGNRHTLDLGGLTDVHFVRDYVYPDRVVDYLFERKADYLVMPEPALPGQADLKARLGLGGDSRAARLRFRSLVTFEIPPYIRPPFTSLQYQFYPAYRKVTVYAIEWLH